METHDRQRRIMLRGALIAGCALAVPALFTTGCNRNESQNSPEPGESETPATPSEGDSNSPQGKSKMSKEQANYQDSPKGNQQCSNCGQFIAQTNTCKIVEGKVSPAGWCTLWTKQV